MNGIEMQRELAHPYAMDRPCFWANMTVLVLTGRLHLATELLLQLPLIHNVVMNHNNDPAVLEDASSRRGQQQQHHEQGRLQQEVWNLVTMFRKAPLPGSPYDTKDEGLSDYDESSLNTMEKNVDFGDVHRSVAYLDADAYIMWEPTASAFSPPGASRALQQWQQVLQQLSFPVLFKHFATLRELVSIVSGTTSASAAAIIQDRPWFQVVLCQVLYQTPTLKPHDLINRIRSLVEGTRDEWIVPILHGDGSFSLEEIVYKRSSAPLPAAVVSVLFCS